MLDYTILKAKPYIELPYSFDGKDKTVCKDLLSNVIYTQDIKMYDCKIITVTSDYIARPDLVSLAAYGDDRYADIICKVNGISNPFELNIGMMLVIPDLNTISMLCKPGKTSTNVETNPYISQTKKTNQKTKFEKRSPAEQLVGESTFIIDRTNKLIYY